MDPVSRRGMLRWMAYCALGAGVALAGGELSGRLNPSSARNAIPPKIDLTAAAPPRSGPSSEPAARSQSTPMKVKVMYFQMPSAVVNGEEHFVLQSPASLRDLLARVLVEHPPLSAMMPTMMILVDGVGARPATTLNDGDEVDFIPATAGG
jgi:molybdopterin converting factor small subunit